MACDNCDQVYQHGLQLAKEVQEATDEHGRRRHAFGHNQDDPAAEALAADSVSGTVVVEKNVPAGGGKVDVRITGRTPTSRAAATPKTKRGEPKGTGTADAQSARASRQCSRRRSAWQSAPLSRLQGEL